MYAELIQNAVDAINERAQAAEPGSFLGKLQIEIVPEQRRLVVRDNGCGIPHEKVGTLIATAKSLKRGQPQRLGFMGFGLTFVAFQSAYLQIETVRDGMTSTRTYHDLYRYVYGNGSPLPEADEDGTTSSPSSAEQGTTITVQFPSEFPRQEKERDIFEAFEVAKNFKLLEAALRTKTAVGNVDVIFGNTKLAEIDVTLEVGGRRQPVPYKFLDYSEILIARDVREAQIRTMEDFEKLVELTKDENTEMQNKRRGQTPAIFSKEKALDIGSRSPLNLDIYIFATSKRYLTNFNRDDLGAKGDEDEDDDIVDVGWGVQNGVMLAISGMPTSIRLDSWTRGEYQPFSVLVNVRDMSSDLDAGRKGISIYRRDQIIEFVQKRLRSLHFFKYSKYITDARRKRKPTDESERDAFADRFKDAKKHASPLTNVYVPCVSEQEVIALFFEMIGSKQLQGYRMKLLSSYSTYDALMEYRADPNEVFTFDGARRPLGISRNTFDDSKRGYLHLENAIVEFKLTLRAFFSDMDQPDHPKDYNDLDLLVCWSVDSGEAEDHGGDIISEIAPVRRTFYGSTHELTINARSKPLQVIALKTLLERLGRL